MPKIKITPAQAGSLRLALESLGGADKTVNVDGIHKVVREAFKIPFKVRIDIAENLSRVLKIIDAYIASRNEIIMRHAGGAVTIDQADKEKMAAALVEITALDAEVVELEYIPLKIEELAGDANNENAISPNALCALMMIKG